MIVYHSVYLLFFYLIIQKVGSSEKLCSSNLDCGIDECCRIHREETTYSGYQRPSCTPLTQSNDWCMYNQTSMKSYTIMFAPNKVYKIVEAFARLCPCTHGYFCESKTGNMFGKCRRTSTRDFL